MLVAVLSDIHSNAPALEAVLRDVRRSDAAEIWLAGDEFGYYPWPDRTFDLLTRSMPVAVLGNHDRWIISPGSEPDDFAGKTARVNREELSRRMPAALAWLKSLPLIQRFRRGEWNITIAHGTPEDPIEGRYYPDDVSQPSWLPGPGEVVIVGQTHYPILRGEASTGLLLNPGSVGQPRDGDPKASWALLDLSCGAAELQRTRYDHRAAIRMLRALGWDERLVTALSAQ